MAESGRAEFFAGAGGLGISIVTWVIPGTWLDTHPALKHATLSLGLLLALGGFGRGLWLTLPGRKAPPLRYMTAPDVIEYMSEESWWGIRKKEQGISSGEEWLVKDGIVHVIALQAFSNAAIEGNIKVMGKKAGIGDYEEVPPTHWLGSKLSDSCLTDTRRSRTESRNASPSIVYSDLLISSTDVYKIWEKPPWWWYT